MPVIRHRFTSRVLDGNPLGDPIARDLYVYVSPDYDPASTRRWPAVLAIVGFTGNGGRLFNVDPLIEPLDAVFATSGRCTGERARWPESSGRTGSRVVTRSSMTAT